LYAVERRVVTSEDSADGVCFLRTLRNVVQDDWFILRYTLTLALSPPEREREIERKKTKIDFSRWLQ